MMLVLFCALANPAFLDGLRLAWQYAFLAPPWLARLTEWQAPPPLAMACAGAFMAAFLMDWKRHRLPWGRLAPLAILLPSAFTQIRHLPLPAIAAAAMFLTLRPIEFPLPEIPRLRRWGFAALLPGIALLVSFVHARHLRDPRFFPAGLYDQMNRRCHLDDAGSLRIFTHHGWGGSLLYRFGGRLKPYMDARNDCFSQETFDRYETILGLGEGWFEKLMEDRPDGAVLRAGHPLIPELLRRGWVPGARWRHDRFLVAPHRSRTLCRHPPPAPSR